MKFDIGIRADWAVTMAGGKAHVEKNLFFGISKSNIALVSPWKLSLKKSCRKFIYQKNSVALPGFVNGHAHLAMTLFRGIEDDLPLHTWLFERIFPLEKKLVTKNFVKTGTELAALECIRFGVTTVCDMYFYSQESAKVWDKAGLRGTFAQVFASAPLPEDKDLGADKEKLFLSLYKKYEKHPRIRPSVGPHAPYTCSDELLRKTAELSKKYSVPLQIHLSETAEEVQTSKTKLGISPVERLSKLAVLSPHTICAHGVHLDNKDIEIMKKSGASIVYNPDSNAKLASGIAPIPKYLAAKIPVALGTDGSASNNDLSLFGAMDLGTKLQKVHSGTTTAMTAKQALYMATLGGAKAIGLGDQIGSLEVGKAADLILIDLQFPHLQPLNNLISHLVYSAQGLEVDTVFCHGKLLMRNKKILSLKPEAIYKKLEIIQHKISKQLGLL